PPTHRQIHSFPTRRSSDLESEGVTHYNGAPTVQIVLVNHPKAHRLVQQINVTIAGAPPSPTLLERMKELNFRPIHGYGLTETYRSEEHTSELQSRGHLVCR